MQLPHSGVGSYLQVPCTQQSLISISIKFHTNEHGKLGQVCQLSLSRYWPRLLGWRIIPEDQTVAVEHSSIALTTLDGVSHNAENQNE